MQRSRTPRAHLVLQYRRIEISGLTFVGGQMSEYKSALLACLGGVLLGE